MKILFLAKHKPFSKEASELIKKNFPESEIIFGEREEPFPEAVLTDQWDYIISYMSPWILPKQLLDNVKIAAINFHPGSPHYPGIGCTNFAIYNEEKEYGVTVHHIAEKVDTGNIIHVERFPIFEKDSVYSLSQRCYAYIYISFIKLFSLILMGQGMPESDEEWQRRPYRRKELNDLCRLAKDMPKDEIEKRIKATDYPGMPGASWDMDERNEECLSGKDKNE